MSFFDFLFKKKKEQSVEERSFFTDALQFNSYSSYQNNRALLLSAVYRCVEVISDAIAELPIFTYIVDSKGFKTEAKNHPVYNILGKSPNRKMSRFTFMKLLVSSMLLKGNAYALIERDGNKKVKSLIFLPAEYVTPIELPNDIEYKVLGLKNNVKSEDIIHLLNFTYDGVNGVSTLQHARKTLGLSFSAEDSAEGFYRGGGNLSGVIKVESSLTSKQKQDIRDSWNRAFSGSNGVPNGVCVLEGNMSYQPISVNPADAQLLDTRKYNVIDVCRFFGVSPIKCFDLSSSSYSTIEASQLAFLTDTIAPLIEKIELEFARKLFVGAEQDNMIVKFDTSVILRTDKQSLASYYNTLFNIAVISPNEIRKTLDLQPVEGGDNHYLQVNITTMDKIVNTPIEENPEASNQLKTDITTTEEK